ncbi:MAG: hypothetical protein B7Z75_03700 [Acidocella sp. 20-57-95]|nr:MAG: hypothetical protein B7Z75_03700 [Acidocella sp. 20-57-95]OYV62316.1 MAG: hypothetical protein B7Z71_01765 [Acidocella sp. 21-58-7]HQT63968.1 DUF2169 domain-containing protein [Acidocella sp.]HQU03258.1 DUF2169 domain-containing protein [Acidocella sp.]
MRMLHHGQASAQVDLAWFFRVAPAKRGAPVLVVCGSLLVSHTAKPPARKETKLTAGHRVAPRKVAGDLLVSGKAYANPAEYGHSRAVRVAVELGKWRKELAVFGDRVWLPGLTGSSPSEPLPFTTIPITYDRAFGGERFAWNPEGMGTGPGERGVRLPNIEYVERRITSPSSMPGPAGFGPIDPQWRPRADMRGSYDAKWLAQNWPGMPDDMDPGYWNEAPRDQQFLDGFRGDEAITIRNMHAVHKNFEMRLPGLTCRAFVKKTDGQLIELSMMLDTVAVDMEAEHTELVWRGATAAATPKLRDMEFLFTMLEPAGALTPPTGCYAIFEALRRKTYPTPEEYADDTKQAAKVRAAKAAEQQAATDKVVAEALTYRDTQMAQARARLSSYKHPSVPANAETGRHFSGIAGTIGPGIPEFGADIQAEMAQNWKMFAELFPSDDENCTWTRERVMKTHADGGDMSGANLSGLDLSALDLTGAKLAGANLSGVNFTDTWLQKAALSKANLSDTICKNTLFSSAVMEHAIFKKAVLTGAHFNRTQISGADFSELDLTGLNFEQCAGAQVNFSSAMLKHANFRNCVLPNADFYKAKVAGILFDDAVLNKASFNDAIGPGASFIRASAENLRARGADFRNAKFTEITALRCNVSQSQFDGADFSRAILTRANFSECKLKRSNFDRASLESADLSEAVLLEATATNVKFLRASFEWADLTGTDMSGSNLHEAGFFRTALKETKFVGCILTGTTLAL